MNIYDKLTYVNAHCDNKVLHRPGLCKYCDKYPMAQSRRFELGINFTGESNRGLLRCPAELNRPLDTINKWHGNIAMTEEQQKLDDEYWNDWNQLLKESD